MTDPLTAIPTSLLLAVAFCLGVGEISESFPIVEGIAQLGAVGILGWLVWYLYIKYIPTIEASHKEERERQASVFKDTMQKLVDDQSTERDSLRQERRDAISAIDKQTEAIDKLEKTAQTLITFVTTMAPPSSHNPRGGDR